MPYTHAWETKGVYRKFLGEVSSGDIIQSSKELVGDSRFKDLKYNILDFSDISEVALDEFDVIVATSFAALNNALNKYIKVAFVSENEELSRLIELYIKKTLEKVPHAQQALFRDLEEARDWVNTKN